jgi:hypothetical protein
VDSTHCWAESGESAPLRIECTDLLSPISDTLSFGPQDIGPQGIGPQEKTFLPLLIPSEKHLRPRGARLRSFLIKNDCSVPLPFGQIRRSPYAHICTPSCLGEVSVRAYGGTAVKYGGAGQKLCRQGLLRGLPRHGYSYMLLASMYAM